MTGKYTGELSENPCRECERRCAGCHGRCEEYKEWRESRNIKNAEEYRKKQIGDIASMQKRKSWAKTLKTMVSNRTGRREHER